MTNMITDMDFRRDFETFCDENGFMICAGTDEYGDNTTETRDELNAFITADAEIIDDTTISGRRFVAMWRSGKRVYVADFGSARLVAVAG